MFFLTVGNSYLDQFPSLSFISKATSQPAPTTVIFDIDDTLYDVGTGFTTHRNTDAVYDFMVKHLGFESKAAAKAVRNEYFARYHSTVKALTMADVCVCVCMCAYVCACVHACM